MHKPKDIVSGDFYWLYAEEDTIWLAVCDCTGHGVPGALMSMTCNSLLNESVNEKMASTPSIVFENVRNGLIKSLKQTAKEGITKDGMDAVLCLWNKKNNSFYVASANNPLLIIRSSGNNMLEKITPDKFPVGVHFGEPLPFTNHEITLQKNDAIYLFSDGYADQFGGPKGKKFKYSQFEKLLLSIHKKSMAEQKEILNNTIDNWRGELEQVDDICIIGVRI